MKRAAVLVADPCPENALYAGKRSQPGNGFAVDPAVAVAKRFGEQIGMATVTDSGREEASRAVISERCELLIPNPCT